jgi:hypothetical protein
VIDRCVVVLVWFVHQTIPYLQLPLDSQGFAASFDLNDTVAWRAFFDTYGLVVLRDVLSEQECKATGTVGPRGHSVVWSLGRG